MGKYKSQKMMRANKKFVEKLDELRRKKSAKMNVDISIPDITSLIIDTSAFRDVEREILDGKISDVVILKMDKRRRNFI